MITFHPHYILWILAMDLKYVSFTRTGFSLRGLSKSAHLVILHNYFGSGVQCVAYLEILIKICFQLYKIFNFPENPLILYCIHFREHRNTNIINVNITFLTFTFSLFSLLDVEEWEHLGCLSVYALSRGSAIPLHEQISSFQVQINRIYQNLCLRKNTVQAQ